MEDEMEKTCEHAFCNQVNEDLDEMEHIAIGRRNKPARHTVFNIDLNGCSVIDVARHVAEVRFVESVEPIDIRELVASLGVSWFEERLDKDMQPRSNDLYDLKRAVCRAIGLGSDLTASEMDRWVRCYDVPDEHKYH